MLTRLGDITLHSPTMNHADHERIVVYLNEANQAKYSEQAIKNRFEAVSAPTYGTDMTRWIPDFEYAHQLLIETLTVYIPDDATDSLTLLARLSRESGNPGVTQHWTPAFARVPVRNM